MFPYGVLTDSPWRSFQIIRQIPWFTAFRERLTVIKLTKIFPASEEPEGVIIVLKESTNWKPFWLSLIQPTSYKTFLYVTF